MGKNFINKELLIFQVPLGTVVKESGRVIADMMAERQTFVAAHGGLGGLGNGHFKTALDRAPDTSTEGTPGEEKVVELELKTIADVGLVSTKINSSGRNESKE